jgi:hypothetical protein
MATVTKRLAATNYPGGAKDRVNSGSANASLEYSVSQCTSATIQLIPVDGSFAGTITVEVTTDGEQWDAVPSGAVTFSAAGTKNVALPGIDKMRLRVSSASGSTNIRAVVNGVYDT